MAQKRDEATVVLPASCRPILSLFFLMLNKRLALPLLGIWADYLWAYGRERDLISLLDDGAGQGFTAWRVLPAPDVWQELVQKSLQTWQIRF